MKTENIPAAIRTVDAGRSHIPPVIVKNYNRSMQYASPIFNEQIPSLPPLPAP
jgi:DNA-binding NarL/FixJ family response regulator